MYGMIILEVSAMSFEEYKEETIKTFKQSINDDEYISKCDEFIRASYDEGVKASNILGSDQLPSGGCAFALIMFYPDLP